MSWWDGCVDRFVPAWASPPLLSLISLLSVCSVYALAQLWFGGQLASSSALWSSPVLVFWFSPLESSSGGATITPASAGQAPAPPPTPASLYLLIALAFFLHQTVERAVLRQARRLRFYSAAAELFSHACAVLAVPFELLLFVNVIQLGPDSAAAPLFVLLSLLLFYLLACQHSVCGDVPPVVVALGPSLEAGLALVSLSTALLGDGFWQQQLAGVSLNAVVVAAAALFLLLFAADFARRVVALAQQTGTPASKLLAPALLPYGCLVGACWLWLLVDFDFLVGVHFHAFAMAFALFHCFLVTHCFVERTNKQIQSAAGPWVALPFLLALVAYLAPLTGYDIEPVVEPSNLVRLCLAAGLANYLRLVATAVHQASASASSLLSIFKVDHSSRLLP